MSTHPTEPPAPDAAPYWGGWPTVGLSALILFGVVAAQLAGAAVLDLFTGFGVMDMFRAEAGLGGAGATDVLMTLYWVGAAVGIVLIARIVRRRGLSLGEYLDLRPVRHLALLPWMLALGAYFVLFVVLPEMAMVREGGRSGLRAGGTFLFFVTAVTVAPVFEEMLFRGFIFAGLARSRLGVAGAILLTTAMWTAVHQHFTVDWFNELYGLAVLFGAGVIFALARVRTGSLTAAIALHAGWNATLLLVDAMVLRRP
ncbi:MAG: lysostaphin resistance A-like protein [Sphingomonadales bacterium]